MQPLPATSRLDPAQRRDKILGSYLRGDELRSMPRPGLKRLVVLEQLVQRFEPGVRYSEVEVNAELRRSWPDVAALRRYLVEAQLLTRTPDGVYWRSGGTVDV